MSFILSQQRPRVAFSVPGGNTIAFDLSGYRCMLDIKTNLYFTMPHAMIQDAFRGNFSTWINVSPSQAVAVSGLTSCGAVFVANTDFSRIAAGHMSGDVQYIEEWCDELGDSDAGPPHYLVWATGPDSSGWRRGTMLMEYMNRLRIPPIRAPAVKSCSEIVLSGRGTVHAAYGSNGIVGLMDG